MCNLYSMTSNGQAIRDLFDVQAPTLPNIPLLEAIFPGYDAPVVRQTKEHGRELTLMHWGFVLPQKDKAPKDVTNARADRIPASPFWRDSFEHRRCLVPATSYAEPKGRKPAIWHWFALAGEEARPLFAFAGIWRQWQGTYRGEVRQLTTFAILTTDANELAATIHPSRMPVILVPEQYQTWLSGTAGEALSLTKPFPSVDMQIVRTGDKSDPVA